MLQPLLLSCRGCRFASALLAALAAPALALDDIDVVTVDVTPFTSPGDSRFGPQNTMGMALEIVDTEGLLDVTEVTPAAFAAMSADALREFDLIAVNNHPVRIEGGLGITWHDVVGVEAGGRVVLNSHDVVRFHMNAPAGSLAFENPGPGVEPFGAHELIRAAALWAGGVPDRTGLLVFNDAAFFAFGGGQGWDNPELELPAQWRITDRDPFQGAPLNGGGYTDIVPFFEDHSLYARVSDVRFWIGSISSFGANITDASFHTIFGTYEPDLFTPTEVVTGSGDRDPGGFGIGSFNAPDPGTDGVPITLVRFSDLDPVADCADGRDNDTDGFTDFPKDVGCRGRGDRTETVALAPCDDGVDNDGDGLVDSQDPACIVPSWPREGTECQDGIDNDGDGGIDFDGGASQHDGIPIDSQDPQCARAARNRESPGPDCGLGVELVLLSLLSIRRRR